MQTFQLPYILSIEDLYLSPVYFILLLLLIRFWKKKYYSNSPLRAFIIPAFLIKIAGSLALALIHNFFYGYSDSHNYYSGAHEIWLAAKENPAYGLELIFKPFENCSAKAQEFGSHLSYSYWAPSNTLMFKISGFIGLFCFGAYFPIAMIFSVFGLIGYWKIFKCFAEEFPKHTKIIFIGCMLSPTTIIWASNIQKEPLCILGLGLCVNGIYNLLKKRISPWFVFEIFAGSLILFFIKSYILYFFIVAAIFAAYTAFNNSGTYPSFKKILNWGLFLLFAAAIYWIADNDIAIGNTLSDYFSGNIEAIQTIQIDQGGSTYTLPNTTDFSITGMLQSYFGALNVSLFRPYLWEINNVFAISNALESTFIMLLTLYLLIRTKVVGFFAFAGKKPILMFSLIFMFLMAPLVGFVAFNFGTLVRYKLPFVPFFYTYLLLMYSQLKQKTKELNG